MNKIKSIIQRISEEINFRRLKKIKSFSLIIIPEEVGIKAHTKKFTVKNAVFLISLYTIISFIVGFYVINYSPLRYIFIHDKGSLSYSDIKKIDELNKRVIFLTRDLEYLKSSNEQLKNALILGDSTLSDSLSKFNPSLNKNKDNPYGGNILEVIEKMFNIQFNSDSEYIQFIYPSKGYISRGFMPEFGHMGIDFVEKTGTLVFAAASGYVVFADYTVNDGYMIILNHPDGFVTVYKHCSVLLKKVHDVVTQGEAIALSGNTGELTTGPHLHFEIWKDGKPVNPKNLLTN